MKTIVKWVLIILVLLTETTQVYAALDISAPNAVLMDYATGKVLYEKNAHQTAYPASTTKILTAILVLENAVLNDVVTKTDSSYTDGASMYILKGESFTVKELLKALLIRSANDAADLLAKHVSGSVEKFANLMNKRAKELGAMNSHFTNPSGLPDERHVTTAYDMAVIAKHAMSFDVFREIVSMPDMQIEPTELTPTTRYFRNSNRFLWGTGGQNSLLYRGQYVNIKYDIIDGIKTGFTNKAQQCLVTSANKDGHRLISVVLGAQGKNIYLDSRALIDYGYENFKIIDLVKKDSFKKEVKVADSIQEKISLYAASDLFAILPVSENSSNVHREIILNDLIKAPVSAGDVLGKIVYTLDSKPIGEVNLIARESIKAAPFVKKIFTPVKTILILLFLFFLWKIFVWFLRTKNRKIRINFRRRNKTSYQFSKNLMKPSINNYKRR